MFLCNCESQLPHGLRNSFNLVDIKNKIINDFKWIYITIVISSVLYKDLQTTDSALDDKKNEFEAHYTL